MARDYRAEYARRQQLARRRGFSDYYAERVSRAEQARPGITRAQARGHGGLGKLGRLRRALRRAGDDGYVDFVADGRDAEGRWTEGELSVLDGGETRIRFGPGELGLLPEALRMIDASPLTKLGNLKYLRQLVGWVEEELPYLFWRLRDGRFLRRFSRSGAALTTARRADALVVEGLESAEALFDRRRLEAKGFALEAA